MTSIPVEITRFSDDNFKRFYLKKESLFVNFLIPFLKCALNLEHFEIKKNILA